MRHSHHVAFDSHGEETIRFVKQAYGLENIRVMTYSRLRNMASLVLASDCFASVWIGRSVRREVSAARLAQLASPKRHSFRYGSDTRTPH